MTKFISRTKSIKYAVAFDVNIHINSFICNKSSITHGSSVVLAGTEVVKKLYDRSINMINSTVNYKLLYNRSVILNNSVIKKYRLTSKYCNQMMYVDLLIPSALIIKSNIIYYKLIQIPSKLKLS